MNKNTSASNVVLVSPDALTVWLFRRGLIDELHKRNLTVHVISADDDYVDRLLSLGVIHHSIGVSRFISPWRDLTYLIHLWYICKSNSFDIAHNFTPKPNIYGAIAEKLAGVPHIIDMVEGLGFTFALDSGFKGHLLKTVMKGLYRISFALCNSVWFINHDDMSQMTSDGIVKPDKSILIPSTGVNTCEYSERFVNNETLANIYDELKAEDGSLFVSMIVSRMIWSKGVAEFVEASNLMARDYPEAKFILVGQIDKDSPDSVPIEYLENEMPHIRWLSEFREDVREILSLSDVVVLPSYYGEGVPRILLEAMAMGKPIVTTDNVGCKDTVENGKNGYLVPVRNSGALKHAIETLLLDVGKRKAFGEYSRTKVRREFDETIVVERVIKELYQI